MQIFGTILGLATFGVGSFLGAAISLSARLASLLANVGRTLSQVLNSFTRGALELLGGAGLGAALTAGIDRAAGEAGAAMAGTDYHSDPKMEGANIGIGALMGLAPGVAGLGRGGGRGGALGVQDAVRTAVQNWWRSTGGGRGSATSAWNTAFGTTRR
ncbi:hypothetical protein ACWV95_20120 [Streptomyces albus]